jgi:hypothetical protein
MTLNSEETFFLCSNPVCAGEIFPDLTLEEQGIE